MFELIEEFLRCDEADCDSLYLAGLEAINGNNDKDVLNFENFCNSFGTLFDSLIMKERFLPPEFAVGFDMSISEPVNAYNDILRRILKTLSRPNV